MDVNKRKVNYLMKMKKISKENAEPEVQEDEEPEPAEERDVQDEEELDDQTAMFNKFVLTQKVSSGPSNHQKNIPFGHTTSSKQRCLNDVYSTILS
jgi:hypothetical protein